MGVPIVQIYLCKGLYLYKSLHETKSQEGSASQGTLIFKELLTLKRMQWALQNYENQLRPKNDEKQGTLNMK